MYACARHVGDVAKHISRAGIDFLAHSRLPNNNIGKGHEHASRKFATVMTLSECPLNLKHSRL